MKGNQAGVQSQILKINPKALYVLCTDYSYNLVVTDNVICQTFDIFFVF